MIRQIFGPENKSTQCIIGLSAKDLCEGTHEVGLKNLVSKIDVLLCRNVNGVVGRGAVKTQQKFNVSCHTCHV